MRLPATLIAAAGGVLILGAASIDWSRQASAAEAHPPSAPLVQPGAWSVTPASASGATLSYQLCFKTGSLDDLRLLLPNVAGVATCPAPLLDVESGQLNWKLACPAPMPQAEARYRFSSGQIEGTLTLTQGNPPATTSQTIVARHVGACAQ